MLKITTTETPSERRWILQGRLVGPWVDELRNSWKNQQHSHRGQRCVIDLCDVTFIDKSGERLLRAIAKKGIQMLAAGVYTKHVLERFNGNGKTQISKVPTKKANSERRNQHECDYYSAVHHSNDLEYRSGALRCRVRTHKKQQSLSPKRLGRDL